MGKYSDLRSRVNLRLSNLESSLSLLDNQKLATKSKLDELLRQQDLIERSRVALEQARPLLSASSVKQLEDLANTALQSIFDIEGQIRFDIESKRFVLKEGEVEHDLADASGGGLVTVISFVFDLFLLVKNGCRRILFYDEAFYAVSSAYYDAFMAFMRQACKDLGVDLCCVSHDERFTFDMADTVYKIENGKAIKLK